MNMKPLITYKRIIKWIFGLTVIFIVYLTIQAINATEDWKFFAMDFNSRDHIISAYAALIGGILAFLSILFVLYQVYEQREQIINEKKEAKKAEEKDLKDRLLLLTNYLDRLKNDIIRHGERMKVFYEIEKNKPSDMNTMYFNTNKSFERVIEMDTLSNFKAFQLYFKGDEIDWQRQFINLYEITDFYNESLKDLKKKYTFHIEDKVAKQKQIAKEIKNLLDMNARLIDDYRIKYGSEDYLTHPWSTLVNEYTPTHYQYLEGVMAEGNLPDFRYISDNLLLPFIGSAMDIRRDYGFDELGSRDIIETASNIRKMIWEVEVYSVQYAEDIEKQFDNYFSSENEFINKLNEIKESIDSKII